MVRNGNPAVGSGSNARLSLWECNRLFPTAPYHTRIAAYMGYDLFKRGEIGSKTVKTTNRQALPFCENQTVSNES